MKIAIGLLLLSAAFSGCSTHQRGPHIPAFEGYDEARVRGLADHYYIAADIDPSEFDTLDRHQRYQNFRHGCALDFYTLKEEATRHRRWQLRENSLQSGYLGTYRRFVSDSAFDQGKYDIPARLTADLEWFASELTRSPLMPFILIIGHTNADGAVDYNQRLSEQRASAVHRFLISQGVPENRIQQFGVGETSPVSAIDTERSNLLNRRVELVTFIPSTVNQKPSRCTQPWGLAELGTSGEALQ